MFHGNKVNCSASKVKVVSSARKLVYSKNNFDPVRGLGTSLATATNWSCNLLINSTYLSLMNRITPSGAFGFYAGLCLLGWIFCIGWYPETAGLGLEEVRDIFVEGWGVKLGRKVKARRTKSEEN